MKLENFKESRRTYICRVIGNNIFANKSDGIYTFLKIKMIKYRHDSSIYLINKEVLCRLAGAGEGVGGHGPPPHPPPGLF